jgi:hypothetical protein
MAQSLVSTASLDGLTTGATALTALQAVFALRKSVRPLTMTPAGDCVFAGARDLASGAADVLDLSGDLVDVFGRPAVFGALVTILIAGAADNAGELTIGGDADAPFDGPFSTGGKLNVAPGGFVLLGAANAEQWSVNGGLLRVTNPTGFPATYDLILLGTPAAHVDGMLDFSDPENSGLVGVL